jgi:hypothetical protein
MPYWLGVHRSFSRWGQAGSFSRVSAFRHPVLAQMQAIATPAAPKGLTARARLALAGVSHRYAVRLWHVRAHLRARRPYRPPAAQVCLERVTRLAGVLASAGAISEQTQAEVVGDMEAALAARSLIDRGMLAGYSLRPATVPQAASFAAPFLKAAGLSPASASPLRAVPVGASAEYEVRGRRIRASLGTLILDSGSATLTVTARLLPSPGAPEPADDELVLELDECTAVDNRGARYHAVFSGGGDDERWDGTFELQPVPPAGVRWLDVSVQGADPVRVDMSARTPSYPTMSAPLPGGTANRYLDRLTLNMLLTRRSSARGSGYYDEDHVVEAVTDLLAAGQIAADSQALGRLAAAAELLNLKLTPELAELQPGRLPDDWLVMLSRWDSNDGPVGAIPLAAQLPELDGLHFLITNIESERESASFQVHARGLAAHHYHGMVTTDPFEWTARDDGGCLHVVEERQSSYGDDCTHLTLRLRPAVRPRARALTISVTGKTGEVGVTVPLDWQQDQ